MSVTSNLGGVSPFYATDCRADISEKPKRPETMLEELTRLRALLADGIPAHLAEPLMRSFDLRDTMAQLEADASIDMLVGAEARVVELLEELLPLRVKAEMISDAEAHLAKAREEHRLADEAKAKAFRTLRILRDER